MGTYYDLLGVARDATDDDLRRAFRKLAKASHPDRDSGTEAAMVRLNQAYETLRDPEKRQAYDQTLRPEGQRLPPRPATPHGPVPGPDPLRFLALVFNPADQAVLMAVARVEAAIGELAYDLYDDDLVEAFAAAVERAQAVLGEADHAFRSQIWPDRLANGLHLYGQGMRQIEDALDDFSTFVLNYDSDLIVQGRDILRGGRELLDEGRIALVSV